SDQQSEAFVFRRPIRSDTQRQGVICCAAILLASLAMAASEANADTLSADTLMGRWCGDTTAYTFTQDKLVVTFFSDGGQRTLRIKKINVGDDWIEVVWDPRDGGNTVFGEFTGDRMAQQPNTEGDMGPRREFHRC